MGFATRSLGLGIDPIYLLVDRLRLHHHFLKTHPALLVPPLIYSIFRAVGTRFRGLIDPPQILADQLTLHITPCPPWIFRPSYGPTSSLASLV